MVSSRELRLANRNGAAKKSHHACSIGKAEKNLKLTDGAVRRHEMTRSGGKGV